MQQLAAVHAHWATAVQRAAFSAWSGRAAWLAQKRAAGLRMLQVRARIILAISAFHISVARGDMAASRALPLYYGLRLLNMCSIGDLLSQRNQQAGQHSSDWFVQVWQARYVLPAFRGWADAAQRQNALRCGLIHCVQVCCHAQDAATQSSVCMSMHIEPMYVPLTCLHPG